MAKFRPEWGDVMRDLDRLQDVEISKDGQQMILRTPATGVVSPLVKTARVALPHNVREIAAPESLNQARQRRLWCYGLHTRK